MRMREHSEYVVEEEALRGRTLFVSTNVDGLGPLPPLTKG